MRFVFRILSPFSELGKAAQNTAYQAISLTVSIRFDGMGRIIRGYSKHALMKASSCRRYESCFEHTGPPQELQLFALSSLMVFCICLSSSFPKTSFLKPREAPFHASTSRVYVLASALTNARAFISFPSILYVDPSLSAPCCRRWRRPRCPCRHIGSCPIPLAWC